MELLFFSLFAGLTVFSALAVAWQRNLVFSAFLLLITFLGIAILFLLTGAEFLAVTQILIYVGGILTLFLFGILLTKRREIRLLSSGIQQKKQGALLGIFLFIWMIFLLHKEQTAFSLAQNDMTSTHLLGYGLVGDYLIPFELAGILLLVVLVGILALASSLKSR